MSQRTIVIAVLLVSSLSVALTATPDLLSKRPMTECTGCNIVLISVDPLRPDHMGLYGYHRNTTPHIDRFAQDATVFRNTYTQSSHTLPALFSTFTSLYVSQHGVITSDASTGGFSDRFTMLPEVLNRSGYRTVAITDGEQVAGHLGFSRGFNQYIHTNKSLSGDLSRVGQHIGDSEDRFFLFYQSFYTHPPYIVSGHSRPERYASLFNGSVPKYREQTIARKRAVRASGKPAGEKWETMMYDYYIPRLRNNSAFARHAISQYDAQVRRVDSVIGKVFDMLRREGMMEDTVVILTSQHGVMLGEHEEWLHFTNLYEEVIRVPLLIRFPGQEERIEVRRRAALIDVAPSILDIVGVRSETFSEQAEGASLIPFVGSDNRIHRFLLSEGLNLNRKAFIDTRTNIKYYTDPVQHRTKVYNLSRERPEQEEVMDPAVRQRIKEDFTAFVADIEQASLQINETPPYFPR